MSEQLSAETWLLVRKVAAYRLLNGDDCTPDEVVRGWARGEMEEWDALDRRRVEGDSIAQAMPSPMTPPPPSVAVVGSIDAFQSVQEEMHADEVNAKLAEPPAAKTEETPAKRPRRTKAEMDVVRQRVRKAYGEKLMSFSLEFGWEPAHEEALKYVDAMGPMPDVLLAPAQVRQAVATVVDTYRRLWDERGRQVEDKQVPGDVPEPLSPQAQQTQRNVDMINQGINPRTGQPFTSMPDGTPIQPEDPPEDLSDQLFADFLSR